MVQSAVHEKPLTKGEQTRERILDVAESAILLKGFAATSIDEVIFEAGITKSGFFYHFRDKNDLARALIERFIQRDNAIQDDIFGRAAELSEDPLHAYLIGLKLLAETMADLPAGHPGCLVVTFVYHDTQFDAQVRALARQVQLDWRARFLAHLERIAERYPPKVEVALETLADMATVVVDGGIVLSKGQKTPQLLADQVMAYRSFVRTVFLGA